MRKPVAFSAAVVRQVAALFILFTPLACTSQGGTHVLGHNLEEFYQTAAPARAVAAAAARGDSVEVAALVRAGADPNAVGRDGMTPLVWALMAGSKPGVRALLTAGADPNGGRSSRLSPLAIAIDKQDPELLALMLARGGNPNGPGRDGEPLLFQAITGRRLEPVRLLVEHGADVSAARGLAGETPLTAAATLNQFHIVRYLLEHGADWRAADPAGATLAYLVQDQTVDSDARELYEAHRWTRRFLEAHGVRFPVAGPQELRRAARMSSNSAPTF